MKKIKQIIAIVAIALLLGLYIVTFIVALTTTADNGRLFAMCLFATVAIPILAFIIMLIVGRTTKTKVIGDPTPKSVTDDNEDPDSQE